MKKRMMLFIAEAAMISGCCTVCNGPKDSKTTFAKDALAPYVENGQLPGAINVFYKDGLQETACVGYADVAAKRPIVLGAHHEAREAGIRKEVVTAPIVCGYIFGHDHMWGDAYLHDGTYGNSQTVQMATLPSAGYYGDLGYALFRTFSDRAELTLRQDDFFFNRDWKDSGKPRPKNWDARVAAHQGLKLAFFYEKPGNFYKS